MMQASPLQWSRPATMAASLPKLRLRLMIEPPLIDLDCRISC
jgi:hypothetical protein